jgi:HEAT repeat protein
MDWRRWACSAMTLLLAASVPAQPTAGAAPLSSAGPVLAEMSKQLEDQNLPTEERLQIITVFGDWATAEVRPALVAVLRDARPEVREAAARALGWHGNNEAVPALRERIETPSESVAVKAAAVRSLGKIGDRSVRALVIAYARDPNTSLREASVWGVALGSLADPADRTDYLIQFAEDRTFDAQARAAAIRTLAGVKEERVVKSLSQILENEPRLAIALPAGKMTEQQLMALRYEQARDVSAYAAGALGRLDARTALPLLLKTAEEPNDFFLRVLSIQVLGAWNVPEAFPVFVRRLNDPLPDVRLLAVMALERLGDSKAVDPITASLADPNAIVRAQAVKALALLGGPKVRPQLEALEQKETEPEVLAALEGALSHLAH